MERQHQDLPWQQVNKKQSLHVNPVGPEIQLYASADHDIYLKFKKSMSSTKPSFIRLEIIKF